jgi:hypothetical protein
VTFRRRPKLEARNVASLQLYSTDDLRRLYQGKTRVGGDDELIQIRDGILRRHELRTEILRRVWWDRFGYFVLFAVSFIAMTAAVIAAIEGWR